MMSHDPLTTWSLRSRDKLKALYLLSKKSIIRKLCKVVPYDEVKSNIMSRDPQTTYSHEVTLQNKNKIFSLE